MPNEEKKNKHMTLDDRIEIQECLSHGMTYKAIGTRIGKDQTTISKEVKKHLTIIPTAVTRSDKDGNPVPTPICPQLMRSPYVCNACKKCHTRCAYDRHTYYARQAHNEYETLLAQAREGIPLGKNEFYEMDRVISEGVKKGQHLYHILQSSNLSVSKSTVYRHLGKGYLSVRAIDFPRVVKFKPRHQKPLEYVPKKLKVGRTHEDFLVFIEENEISSWVEMDTVIGRIGGKVIMTFDFTFCNFMFGLLLDNKSASEAAMIIRRLKNNLAIHNTRFGDVFPLILTDNGGEFSDISAFESDSYGIKETDLFFCDPMQSCQKPRVEKNHTLFRDIIPKGQSFDGLTQEMVNLIFSHMNSVKRKSLNGKSPYEVFCFTYAEEIAETLGIQFIPAKQVIQSQKLFKA